jgi:trk system potassium uptake protein TrkH
MTLTTYYILFTTRQITQWHSKILGAEFTLPNTIKIHDFIRSVIVFTLTMEVLGALAFFFVFRADGFEFGAALWYGIFHSISAFCTAGFALFNDSFMEYSADPAINAIISVLAITGSLGFIVITDLWYWVRGKTSGLSFTSMIILYGFLILLGLGTLIFYFLEPTLVTSDARLSESFFLAMTSMTTVGFNTIDTGDVSLPILLFVTFLMYIGASPSGTAGGMKITTLTAMLAVLKSRLFGQKRISFLGRTIPFERLYVATSTFILYTSIIFLFTWLLSFSESFSLSEIVFEVASALGTVGLSTGVTGELTGVGKALIIALMFIGRVGVLTFGFALLERKIGQDEIGVEGDLAV